jgi:hypothetical protein
MYVVECVRPAERAIRVPPWDVSMPILATPQLYVCMFVCYIIYTLIFIHAYISTLAWVHSPSQQSEMSGRLIFSRKLAHVGHTAVVRVCVHTIYIHTHIHTHIYAPLILGTFTKPAEQPIRAPPWNVSLGID